MSRLMPCVVVRAVPACEPLGKHKTSTRVGEEGFSLRHQPTHRWRTRRREPYLRRTWRTIQQIITQCQHALCCITCWHVDSFAAFLLPLWNLPTASPLPPHHWLSSVRQQRQRCKFSFGRARLSFKASMLCSG